MSESGRGDPKMFGEQENNLQKNYFDTVGDTVFCYSIVGNTWIKRLMILFICLLYMKIQPGNS